MSAKKSETTSSRSNLVNGLTLNKKVIVKSNDVVVLEYPINSIVREDTMLLHHPDQLLTYRNDSLMLVLQDICIEDTVVTNVRCYDFQLFKKQ